MYAKKTHDRVLEKVAPFTVRNMFYMSRLCIIQCISFHKRTFCCVKNSVLSIQYRIFIVFSSLYPILKIAFKNISCIFYYAQK